MKKITLTTYLWRCKRQNLITLFWILLGSLCVTANGWASGQALAAIVALNFTKFFYWSLCLLAVNLLWSLQLLMVGKMEEKSIQGMDVEIRKDITEHLTKLSYQTFHEESVGTYQSWLTNDIVMINEAGFEVLSLMISQFLTITFSIIVLITYHVSLLATTFIFVVLMLIVPKFFQKSIQERALKVSQANEGLTKKVLDSLKGYDELFAFGKKSWLVEHTSHASQKLATQKVRYAGKMGQLMGSSNGVSLISQIAILFHAGLLYGKGWVSFGVVGTAQYFAANIFAGLTGFTANLGELRAVTPLFEKFFAQTEAGADGASVEPLELLTGEDVSYTSQGQQRLKEISFEFAKGEKYALIGDSGSGKSTLLNILAGRLPDFSGKLYWNGQELTQREPANWLQHVTYVNQTPHLFNETILDNLALGTAFPLEDVEKVLQAVGLWEFVLQLPEGLQTVLAEDGQNFSGGQKQRLALARALLFKRSLFLVDEGTSALDASSVAVLENILLADPELTLLLVSHHLSAVTKEKFTAIYTTTK